jgi:DNA (cytosine-5)-methyltransferase 1
MHHPHARHRSIHPGGRSVKPRLLDLFCCEGGASQGYADAGFDVIGVDIDPQPRYPLPFVRADALAMLRWMIARPGTWNFSAIHASPPCQDHSVSMQFGLTERGTKGLLGDTIELLQQLDTPWVVENVVSRSTRELMPGAFTLCGSMFGLGAHDSRGNWRVLKRHRLFLTNFPVAVPADTCRGQLIGGVYGHGEQGVNGGRGYGFAADAARQALGMPWVTRDGAKEAIPPAYTRHIGERLMAHLSTPAALAA